MKNNKSKSSENQAFLLNSSKSKQISKEEFISLFGEEAKSLKPSDLKTANYLIPGMIRYDTFRPKHKTIAEAVGLSRRSVISSLKRLSFIIDQRYRFKNGRQKASVYSFQSWISIDILKHLASLFKSLRYFPLLLLLGTLPVKSLPYANSSYVAFVSKWRTDRLLKEISHHIIYKEVINKQASTKGTISSYEETTTKIYFEGESVIKHRKKSMELPIDVTFSAEQLAIWDSAPLAVKQYAAGRLQAALTARTSITNKTAWLLAVVKSELSQKRGRQESNNSKQPLSTAQRFKKAPFEKRVSDAAGYYSHEQLKTKLDIARKRLAVAADDHAISDLQDRIAVYEEAIKKRLLTHPDEKPRTLEKTPHCNAYAQSLYIAIPMAEKEEWLRLKAQGDEKVKNNPIVDIILERYIKEDRERYLKGLP